MDSGTSSSMQSSSGAGDEEYDSRSEKNPVNNHRVKSPVLPSNPPLPQQQGTCFGRALFTPNHLDMFVRNSDMSSHLNITNFTEITPSSSAPLSQNPDPSGGFLSDSLQNNRSKTNNGGRNPRKRARASRRPPTTVLTTDTSNFKAMVQEFTGIPNQPLMFSGSAPVSLFPRTNIHSTTTANGLGSFDFTPPPFQSPPPPLLPYNNLLKSYPQKLVLPSSSSTAALNPPFLSPSAAASSMSSNKESNPFFFPEAFFEPNDQRKASKTGLQIMDILSSSFPSTVPARRNNNTENFTVLDFHGGSSKASDTAVLKETFRTDQGMVESWISASDPAI